jgi:MFS transporter, ACS family, hexuronate transporter
MTSKAAPIFRGPQRRPGAIPSLRWWIAGILLASTIINYIDRQTLSLLAPFLKQEYHWSNVDYANIVIAFRISYSIGQTLCGRLMDRLGTRRGLATTVLWYSIVSICTPFARGLRSFAGLRFLLGAGESANWPGATKAVAEWFPKRERALATAFFDSGSSIGGAIAPFIVLSIFFRWGWRPAVAIPGLLGFLWLIVWRSVYHGPENHPRISAAEREMVLSERREAQADAGPQLRWLDLLKLPQTWGTIAAKTFTDPVWFFITDWFPIYLVAKGISLRNNLIAVWVPFLAADLGSLFGGWLSGRFLRQGWSLGVARKAVVVFGGIGTTLLIPTIFTGRVALITLLFGLATFCYGSFTTVANVLPADLYATRAVASVSGLSGTGAGIGTIIAFELVGHLSDVRAPQAARHSFDPIMIAAGLVPLAGMILVLLLVRNTRATDQGLVHRI